jgi:hypothetical protein
MQGHRVAATKVQIPAIEVVVNSKLDHLGDESLLCRWRRKEAPELGE